MKLTTNNQPVLRSSTATEGGQPTTAPAGRNSLLVLTGPTAVGKTDIAVRTASMADAEIISADSIQIYRGLDIGSAKPTEEERMGIPHHLIDVADPCDTFSVARYKDMAEAVIQDIWKRGKQAILTGGTGLYISAVIDGFSFPEDSDDPSIRSALEEEADREGLAALHNRLEAVDPESASRIHPNDRRRIIRALEVYKITGEPLSHFKRRGNEQPRFGAVIVVLTMPRALLYSRIEARVDALIETGLVDEVRHLMSGECAGNSLAMQGLGYKEIAAYIEGRYSLEEAIETLKRDTRRYAKRQLTWWRRDPRVHWLDVCEYDNKEAIARQIMDWWSL
ncbi:MAG: tRNA (adenosine(37)-N6)-dimethylallyltransferase MiaA [bacterium]|nr:tRNA (adenosine(37)-N6)-dimethylallyltransferase MiaA [bacterium]